MEDQRDQDSTDWNDDPVSNYFLMTHKEAYIKTSNDYSRAKHKCIICGIVNGAEENSFVIYKNATSIVFLNLYPYNDFHLMISPLRHVTGYEELDEHELVDLSQLLQRSILMLTHHTGSASYNAGFNQGEWSGGSIKHFHFHLVPRYRTDINFVEIIGKSRTVLKTIKVAHQELLTYRDFLSGEKSLEECDLSK